MSYLTIWQIQAQAKFSSPHHENLARMLRTQKNTIFLSHSHQDADIVASVINFLLTLGVDVYVDWMDPSMPATTSGQTAAKIKVKIKDSDRFLVLVSENSVNSKWVPWELGYADGVKRIEEIAILPIRRTIFTDDSTFDGLEYMELYPVIKEGFRSGLTFYSIFPPERIGNPHSGQDIDSRWLKRGTTSF